MPPILEKAFGYRGDTMHLPVRDVSAALPFYETVLGFHVVSRATTPRASIVLARDQVQIGFEENGGDPAQDGCAFHVTDLAGLLVEWQGRGLAVNVSDMKIEHRDGTPWNVVYVIAPDGLCYWFGERAT